MAGLGRIALTLLGLLAYQNRDKLGELWRRGQQNAGDPGTAPSGTAGSGGMLSDILDRFRQSGSGAEVDSWVGKGPNAAIEPNRVEAALDPETLDQLAQQTGLSHDELLRRLALDLPQAVDRMTPEGQLPQPGETTDLLDDVPISRQTGA